MPIDRDQGGGSAEATPCPNLGRTAHPTPPIERHGYEPPAGRRWVALIGTGSIYAVVLAGFLITIDHVASVHAPSAPIVVELRPLASPPETPPQEKEAPKPVEEKKKSPEPPKVQPIEHIVVSIAPVSVPTLVVTPMPSDPSPQEQEPAAPKTIPAPSAPQAASNAPDSWEGRLLARLNKHRHYPAASRNRREQGVAYIKFRMNRDGRVLTASIVRGSGFTALDREALATLRRAEPLPRIPADRPDEIEISVPVEFYIR